MRIQSRHRGIEGRREARTRLEAILHYNKLRPRQELHYRFGYGDQRVLHQRQVFRCDLFQVLRCLLHMIIRARHLAPERNFPLTLAMQKLHFTLLVAFVAHTETTSHHSNEKMVFWESCEIRCHILP